MKVNISVIIPLYNKETIIERSLQSVLSQDYEDFEVVIVNDGSTDRSMDIVRSIQDPRIVLIEQENGGPSKARNTGVQHAKGEWIVFLDADDELLPNALHHFFKLIVSHSDADFISCSFYDKTTDGCYKRNIRTGYIVNPFKDFILRKFITRTGASIYKKECCLQHPFNNQIKRNEDFDVWFRMFHHSKIYSDNTDVLCVNQVYTEASKGRKDVREDYIGHLNFRGKKIWEKLSLYQLYIENRDLYPNDCAFLYPSLRNRWDYLFFYKLLSKFSKNPIEKL